MLKCRHIFSNIKGKWNSDKIMPINQPVIIDNLGCTHVHTLFPIFYISSSYLLSSQPSYITLSLSIPIFFYPNLGFTLVVSQYFTNPSARSPTSLSALLY